MPRVRPSCFSTPWRTYYSKYQLQCLQIDNACEQTQATGHLIKSRCSKDSLGPSNQVPPRCQVQVPPSRTGWHKGTIGHLIGQSAFKHKSLISPENSTPSAGLASGPLACRSVGAQVAVKDAYPQVLCLDKKARKTSFKCIEKTMSRCGDSTLGALGLTAIE